MQTLYGDLEDCSEQLTEFQNRGLVEGFGETLDIPILSLACSRKRTCYHRCMTTACGSLWECLESVDPTCKCCATVLLNVACCGVDPGIRATKDREGGPRAAHDRQETAAWINLGHRETCQTLYSLTVSKAN